MTAQEQLVGRIRAALRDRDPREVSMFGGVSFMVDGRMVVAARKDGTLLVRVGPTDAVSLLARPGAQSASMSGRRMGDGWVSVDPVALEGQGLDAWLEHALSFHAAQDDKRSP